MATPLSASNATRICQLHSVETRVDGDWLEVKEEFFDADPVWAPCPRTRADLMAWLGY